MEHNNTALIEANIARIKECIGQCTDGIKFLTGDIPPGSAISFSINKTVITTFQVSDSEANFLMGFYMSWYAFFVRRLKEEKQLLMLSIATAN
jgi:hypothetical protein